MRLIFSLSLLLLPLTASGQESHQITIGSIDSLYSSALKESRKILVHLPMTEPDEFALNQKYPVVYVLDGEVLFQQVVAITENLSGGSGNFNYPKMIVVGITNTNRTRDLTPTHSTEGSVMPGFLLEASGGGGHFTTFLEKELIPHIDSHYPAAPYRVIIGHSFGGLTAIHHLLNQDRLFHAYVAIDPSLWWDNLNYLRQVKERFPKVKLKNVSLFVAVANTMSGSLTRQTVIEDKSPGTLPIRALLDFDRFVKESGSDLIYRSKFYQDYDHGSVPLVAVYDALPFIFNFYAVNLPFGEFFDPHYKNDSLLINHYQQVSERMGYRIPPPGELVDALAHQLMDSHQLDRAYKFLQLNLRSYPGSYKTHEAMGDYYRAKNDQARAVEFYLQALAIKETSDVRAKLEKLKN